VPVEPGVNAEDDDGLGVGSVAIFELGEDLAICLLDAGTDTQPTTRGAGGTAIGDVAIVDIGARDLAIGVACKAIDQRVRAGLEAEPCTVGNTNGFCWP
jgi:hypothetical protein